MRKHPYYRCLALLPLVLLWACGSYKQNILVAVGDDFDPEAARLAARGAPLDDRIRANDKLGVEVYTNQGERIIDPDLELAKDLPGNQKLNKPQIVYWVQDDGRIKLPQLGWVAVAGLTINQVESLLEKRFSDYYTAPFVKISQLNKRIVVLGAAGNKVVPVPYGHMSLLEVLALTDGIGQDAKMHNIRVIRGQSVFLVDLSTVESMQNTAMDILPGDVVYVEPVRRPLAESAKNYGPLLGIFTGLATLLVVLLNAN